MTGQHEIVSTSFYQHQRQTPRYTFFTSDTQLTPCDNTFCALDEQLLQCRYERYVESVLLVSSLGMLVAALVLLAGPVFWACRRCACGGRYASFGVFLPGEKFNVLRGDGYTKKQLLRLKWLIWSCSLLGAVAAVFGFVGSQRLHDSLNASADLLLDTGTTVAEQLWAARDLLLLGSGATAAASGADSTEQQPALPSPPFYLPANFTAELNATVEAADRSVADVTAVTRQWRADIRLFDSARGGVVQALLSLVLLLFALSSLSACAVNGSRLAVVATVSGFVLLSLTLLLFSLHYSLSVVMADVCSIGTDGDGLQPGNNVTDALLEEFVPCARLPLLPRLEALAAAGRNLSRTAACEAFDRLCNTTIPCFNSSVYTPAQCFLGNCSSLHDWPFDCTNGTQIQRFPDAPVVADFVVGCPHGLDDAGRPVFVGGGDAGSRCPWNTTEHGPCTLSNGTVMPVLLPCTPFVYRTVRLCSTPGACNASSISLNVSVDIMQAVRSSGRFEQLLATSLPPLLSAQPLRAALGDNRAVVCDRSSDALLYVLVSTALLVALVAVGTVLAIVGMKRFDPLNKQMYFDQTLFGVY